MQQLHWLSALQQGGAGREGGREREKGRHMGGGRAALLLGDRECPLVASADNSTSAFTLLLGEQSAGGAESWAQNGTLEKRRTLRNRQRETAHVKRECISTCREEEDWEGAGQWEEERKAGEGGKLPGQQEIVEQLRLTEVSLPLEQPGASRRSAGGEW